MRWQWALQYISICTACACHIYSCYVELAEVIYICVLSLAQVHEWGVILMSYSEIVQSG